MQNTLRLVLGLVMATMAVSSGCRVRRATDRSQGMRLSLEVAPSANEPARSFESVIDVSYNNRGREILSTALPIATVRCPAAATPAPLWGTDVYTDDSSICAAALHSGLIRADTGGLARIVRLGPMPSYRASTRNGVTANAFGAFEHSFAFVNGPNPSVVSESVVATNGTHSRQDAPGPWARAARDIPAESAGLFQIECPPNGATRAIWGTRIYTDDSSACVAAVHAGLITLEGGGTVRGYKGPGLARYVGSTQHGVTSTAYGRFAGSFAFDLRAFDDVPRPPQGTTEFAWNEDLSGRRESQTLRIRVFCAPGGEADTVWGSGVYTDDSSVCTAAVHAGLVTFERGGVFTVETAPGRDSYEGTERNGVTTQDFERFERSFRVRR
ncbi:MAG: hypothetical protein JNK05_23960 [Myxococcales bacterium]|nr:hypothetical protein [Myxococcales bacterium]